MMTMMMLVDVEVVERRNENGEWFPACQNHMTLKPNWSPMKK